LQARVATGRIAAMLRVGLAAIAVALACGCANVEAMRSYRAGTDALDRGEPQRAVADLERAATLAPEVSAIQNHLGIAYEEVGRNEDARKAYERAVALDCDNRAAEDNLNQLRSAADAAEPNTSQGAAR
jgi:Flp pilus assembly protein TadD